MVKSSSAACHDSSLSGNKYSSFKNIYAFQIGLRLMSFHWKAARGIFSADLVILNYGQVTWTTSELAPSTSDHHITPSGYGTGLHTGEPGFDSRSLLVHTEYTLAKSVGLKVMLVVAEETTGAGEYFFSLYPMS
ncbi:hypothetical protein TNCV_2511851 [Trichonephila clavipes]|nr:hypothetical protein TNCV_2511851 [Trichonephila clavipes]